MAKTKLTHASWAIAGEKAVPVRDASDELCNQLSTVEIKGSGHWIMEERQKERSTRWLFL